MSQIFGEREMALLHRVAMEMGYADRVQRTHGQTAAHTGMEIIQLDEEDDRVIEAPARVPAEGPISAADGKCYHVSRLIYSL